MNKRAIASVKMSSHWNAQDIMNDILKNASWRRNFSGVLIEQEENDAEHSMVIVRFPSGRRYFIAVKEMIQNNTQKPKVEQFAIEDNSV
jgi:hypothetical protein